MKNSEYYTNKNNFLKRKIQVQVSQTKTCDQESHKWIRFFLQIVKIKRKT